MFAYDDHSPMSKNLTGWNGSLASSLKAQQALEVRQERRNQRRQRRNRRKRMMARVAFEDPIEMLMRTMMSSPLSNMGALIPMFPEMEDKATEWDEPFFQLSSLREPHSETRLVIAGDEQHGTATIQSTGRPRQYNLNDAHGLWSPPPSDHMTW